jgi:hypothetical protein
MGSDLETTPKEVRSALTNDIRYRFVRLSEINSAIFSTIPQHRRRHHLGYQVSGTIVLPLFRSKNRNASESLHAPRGASHGAAA